MDTNTKIDGRDERVEEQQERVETELTEAELTAVVGGAQKPIYEPT